MFGQVGWLLLGTSQFDLEGGRSIPALKFVEVAFPPYKYIKKNRISVGYEWLRKIYYLWISSDIIVYSFILYAKYGRPMLWQSMRFLIANTLVTVLTTNWLMIMTWLGNVSSCSGRAYMIPTETVRMSLLKSYCSSLYSSALWCN